jgi:hypothetical protein
MNWLGLAAQVLTLGGPVAFGLLILAAAVVAVVVGPAVWSKKKQRRDAALAVLDRLFRYRRLGAALVPHDQDCDHGSESRDGRTKPAKSVNPLAGSRPQSPVQLPPSLSLPFNLRVRAVL